MATRKAISAGIWSTIDLSARLGIHFFVSIALARILTPTDFGIFALVMFFVAISQVLVDRGLATALIQSEAPSLEQKTSLFWHTILFSLFLGLVTAAIAPAFADYFGYPVLEPLLYVCAAIVPTSALASIPTALLQRDLRFDVIAKAGLAASTLSAVAAIAAALYGAGVWSFAAQAATYSLANSCLIWRMGRWNPLPRLHLGAALPLVRFGSFVTLTSLVDVVYTNGASLIIGRLHGARDLGFYNRAQNLQNLPGNILAAIVTRVALPLFSAKVGDREALRSGVRLVQGTIMLINLPLMAALAIIPDLVIQFLYGPKWLFAAPILRILAVGGILFPLQVVNMQLVLSQGRSGLSFKIEFLKKIIGLAALLIGSLHGLEGMAIGQAVSVYLGFFINAAVTGRMIGYSPGAQLKDLSGIGAITAVMTGTVLAVRPLLGYGNDIDLLLLALLGGAIFVICAVLLRIGIIDELIEMTPLRRFAHRIPTVFKR
ncbi:lipopolysaccharide biosynthesis protein [Sphingomonas sp. 179-A 2A2 NHS]|uniref:lipopolysaccharide biosynthesis protein n=1 Tax=Sphingomonas sp. 179-A 2A2 NHS TaxID=3374290 RepID=UPI003879FB0C